MSIVLAVLAGRRSLVLVVQGDLRPLIVVSELAVVVGSESVVDDSVVRVSALVGLDHRSVVLRVHLGHQGLSELFLHGFLPLSLVCDVVVVVFLEVSHQLLVERLLLVVVLSFDRGGFLELSLLLLGAVSGLERLLPHLGSLFLGDWPLPSLARCGRAVLRAG